MIETRRQLHYDILRILAAFSVVMLHSAAQYWYDMDVSCPEWRVANAYNALFRFGVPVFVMISGALFLDKERKVEIRKLYLHNILRMLILYAVWSCIYGLYDCRFFALEAVGVKDVLREMIYSRYHLWFLPMIAGIYVLLPVLRSWIHNGEQKSVEYFLVLFLVLQIGAETLRAVTVTEEILYVLELVDVELVCGYVGYFVWGYYLMHVGLQPKIRKCFYIMFVPSLFMNLLLGNIFSERLRPYGAAVYDSFGLFTFIIVTCIFLFVTEWGNVCRLGERAKGLIEELSADTLGVYVMHIGLMEILQELGIDSMLLPNMVGIPLLALLCFGVCLLLAALLRRIPFVGRYLC